MYRGLSVVGDCGNIDKGLFICNSLGYRNVLFIVMETGNVFQGLNILVAYGMMIED